MRKYRIVYGTMLLASLLLFLFSNRMLCGALFAGLILIPLLSAICNRYYAPKMEISLEMQQGAEKGKECTLCIVVKNPSAVPSGVVRAELVWTNIWLGESRREVIVCPLCTGKVNRQEICFQSRHCGKIVCSLCHVTICDLFGMTGYQIERELRKSIVIYPPPGSMQTDSPEVPKTLQESETYDVYRHGSGQNEWYGVHEYMPGDPVKSIHWKLSAKLDGEPVVREYGHPADHDILVLAEVFRECKGRHISNDCMDRVMETTVSVAYALAEHMEFHMGWYDAAANCLQIRKITKREDILMTLQTMLSTPVSKEGPLAARHYLYEQEQTPFTKMCYITLAGAEELLGQLRAMQETEVILVQERGERYAETTS